MGVPSARLTPLIFDPRATEPDVWLLLLSVQLILLAPDEARVGQPGSELLTKDVGYSGIEDVTPCLEQTPQEPSDFTELGVCPGVL